MLSALKRRASAVTGTPGSGKKEEALKPILEGPLLYMEIGGKEVQWVARHVLIYPDATVEVYVKKGGSLVRRDTLTGDHFVADAAGFTNGWQISDFESILYFASGSEAEKTYWCHVVAGVIRRLMEPMDALPPQYAQVAMKRHSASVNKGPAFQAEEPPPPPPPPPERELAATPPPPPQPLEEDELDDAMIGVRTDSAAHLVDAMAMQRDEAEAKAAREAALAKAANDEVGRLEERLAELERTAGQDGDAVRREADEAKAARDAANARCEEAVVARDSAARDAQNARDAMRSLEADNKRLEEQIAALEDTVKSLQEGPAVSTNENDKWAKALDLERKRTATQTKRARDLNSELGKVTQELAELRAAKSTPEPDPEVPALKTSIKSLEAQVARLQRQNQDRDKDMVSQRAKLEAAQAAEAEARGKARDASARADSLAAEVETLKTARRASIRAAPAPIAEEPAAAAVKKKPPPPPPRRQVTSTPPPPPTPAAQLSAAPPPRPPAPAAQLSAAPPPRPPAFKAAPPPQPKREPGISAELEKTLVAETAKMWSRRAEAIEEEQKVNVFSSHFDADATKQAARTGEYGKPVPGSLTDQRWQKGRAWVDDQIDKLTGVIRDIGDADVDGTTTVTFGELFYKYADISDSLVGILMRAKKRNRLYYQGDMLFQTKDDHVVITVPAAA